MAEVLITLGIVGIVAAMTLPSLIGKANDFILKQQFKKAYNTITNAHNRVFAELGSYPECYYTNNGSVVRGAECKEYWTMMRKILNPNAVCKNNAYAGGCIPKYKGIETVIKDKNPNLTEEELTEKIEYQKRNCGSWFESRIHNGQALVLKDGTIIISPSTDWHNFGLIIAVDVNGNKGPNKWGYDIFHFNLSGYDNHSKLEPMYGGCSFVEKGGNFGKHMLQDVYKK